MARIGYFIAGTVPTVDEAADIAKLNSLAAAPYEVTVMTGLVPADYGAGRNVPLDFAAGTIPDAYSEVPTFDPDNPPASPSLPATQAIVSDGDEFEVTGGTVSVAVAAGVPTFTFTAAE